MQNLLLPPPTNSPMQVSALFLAAQKNRGKIVKVCAYVNVCLYAFLRVYKHCLVGQAYEQQSYPSQHNSITLALLHTSKHAPPSKPEGLLQRYIVQHR
jgi:hypothetical protein